MRYLFCLLLIIGLLGCKDDVLEPIVDDAFPEQPEYVTPLNGSELDTIVTFKWHVSKGASSYRFQLSKDSIFSQTNVLVDKTLADSTVYTFNGVQSEQVYYWRVFAVNKNGFSKEVTKYWSFRGKSTQSSKPGDFTLLTPTNNILSMSVPVEFTWTKATGVEYYQLEIAEDEAFANIRYRTEHLYAEIYSQTDFPGNMKFYWRVKAYNSFGIRNSETIHAFTTQSVLPIPPAVVMSSPSNGATDVGIPVNCIWQKTELTESYTLQIATDKYFQSIVNTYTDIRDTFKLISNLGEYKTYYWRVKATNASGTSGYNWIFSFRTKISYVPGGPCPGLEQFEYGGKIYKTIQIADQCWMKENLDIGVILDTTTYPNDTLKIEKHCYQNNPSNCAKYGGMYKYSEAVNPLGYNGRDICPVGWHLPSKAELEKLVEIVKNGNYLKAIGEGRGDGMGTDSSGFSLLLAGYMGYNNGSGYLGELSKMLSSTPYYSPGYKEYYYLELHANDSAIKIDKWYESYGSSVRCIKD